MKNSLRFRNTVIVIFIIIGATRTILSWFFKIEIDSLIWPGKFNDLIDVQVHTFAIVAMIRASKKTLDPLYGSFRKYTIIISSFVFFLGGGIEMLQYFDKSFGQFDLIDLLLFTSGLLFCYVVVYIDWLLELGSKSKIA